MINSLLSSVLVDLLALLRHSERFFDLKSQDRSGVLNKLNFSENLKSYLTEVKLESFLSDMEELTKNLLVSPFVQNRKVGMKMLEMLSTYFDFDLDVRLDDLIEESENSHYILVQSPIKLEAKMKDEIRENLVKRYPNSSPVFIVNRDLIGGLRIYVDGKTEDLSWISKINILTSINKI